jgi:hypothetical protein
VERIAALQRDGWHERAAQLARAGLVDQCRASRRGRGAELGPSGSLCTALVLDTLAASSLWCGGPLEARALASLASLLPGGPGASEREGRTGGESTRSRTTTKALADLTGSGRSLGAEIIDSLALAELAQQGLVDVVTARRALALVLERCHPEALAAASASLGVAGLRQQRVVPMLAGSAAGLMLLEGVGSVEQTLDRCRQELGSTLEQDRARSAQEAVVVLRVALRDEQALDESSPGGTSDDAPAGSGRARPEVRPCTHLLLTQAATVLEALRSALDALDDWPLRRAWFELEARRLALSARVAAVPAARRAGAEWVLRGADLALVGGLVGRYPLVAPKLIAIMARAPLAARTTAMGAGRSVADR